MSKNIKTREPSLALQNRFKNPNNPNLGQSIVTENIKQEILFIRIEAIRSFKGQSRINFDMGELNNLAETIKTHGIRQPLTVIPISDMAGHYEVVSGERRLKAAQLANLEKVPCLILNDDKKAEEIAIIENLHRKDLSPIEEGFAFKRLLDLKLFSSMGEISKQLSINKSKISESVGFASMPKEILDSINENQLYQRNFLRKIVNLSQNEMVNTIAEELGVRRGEHLQKENFEFKDELITKSEKQLNLIKTKKSLLLDNARYLKVNYSKAHRYGANEIEDAIISIEKIINFLREQKNKVLKQGVRRGEH